MIFRAQVAAIRASAAAIVAQCDALLAGLAPAASAPGACAHPADARVRRMSGGASDAWACGACGAEGEGA